MRKRGQAEVLQVELLFELLAAIVVAAFLVYAAISYSSMTEFNKKYLEKDLGLLLNVVYSAPGSVEVSYPLSEQYKVNIRGDRIEVSHIPSLLADPFNKKSALLISGSAGKAPQVNRVEQKAETCLPTAPEEPPSPSEGEEVAFKDEGMGQPHSEPLFPSASNGKILRQALYMENLAYNWAGRYGYTFGPTNYKLSWGVDCVGLLYVVARQLGIIGKSSGHKVAFQSCKGIIEKIPGKKITDKEIRDSNFGILMPGDFMCVNSFKHGGVYFGMKDGEHMLLNARGSGIREVKSGCGSNCCKPGSGYRVRLTPLEDYLKKGNFAALRVDPSQLGKYPEDIPDDVPAEYVCGGLHSVPDHER